MNTIANIVEFAPRYGITEDGKVWSERSQKFLTPFATKDRYYIVPIYGKNYYVHRLVATYFVDNLEFKPEVNHKDGDKLNNRFSNLEWVTPRENLEHAHISGLLSRAGEKNSHSWLTEEAVLLIRELVELGHTQRIVGEWFGLQSPAVSEIVNRKRWSHI